LGAYDAYVFVLNRFRDIAYISNSYAKLFQLKIFSIGPLLGPDLFHGKISNFTTDFVYSTKRYLLFFEPHAEPFTHSALSHKDYLC